MGVGALIRGLLTTGFGRSPVALVVPLILERKLLVVVCQVSLIDDEAVVEAAVDGAGDEGGERWAPDDSEGDVREDASRE